MKRKQSDFTSDAALATAQALGKNVTTARLARGWSREELAQRARTSVPTLQRLEAGGVAVAMGTWLDVLNVLGLLSRLKLSELHDPRAERILDQTRAKHPVRPSDKDLDF